MTFKYISAKETYKSLYYQLPKVLFTSVQYINMSNDSKIAYAMLQDRCEYSINNNWIDSNGYVYFIFTTSDLMELLHCGNKKIAKIKKELREFNLLKEKRIPPKKLSDGSFKTFPPQLYLGQLEVTALDVYIDTKAVTTSTFSENVKTTLSEEVSHSNNNPENVKMTLSEQTPRNMDFPESVKMTPNLNKSLDTSLDTLLDTEKVRQAELLNIWENDTQDNLCVNQEIKKTIRVFSNTLDDAYNTIGIILRAKKKVEKELGCSLAIELDMNQDDLHDTLRRIYKAIYTSKKDNNDNYMFRILTYWFNSIAPQKNNTGKQVPMNNWVEN